MANITTLQSTDNGSTSRNVINTNFSNLNNDKEEISNKETSSLDTSTTKYPCNNVVKIAIDAKMSNPMTSQGDIIYGGTDGTPTRLAKGSDGQILTLSSGVPSWQNNNSSDPYFIAGRDFGTTDSIWVYSDDLSNLPFYSATSPYPIGITHLFTRDVYKYYNTNQQEINSGNIWDSSSNRQCIISNGYIYVLLTDGESVKIFRCSTSNDISSSGNWQEITISGGSLGNDSYLIGYGDNKFWIADNNSFLSYSLSGTTLTYQNSVNVGGSNHSGGSRVNNNGIYANASSCPYFLKADFSGNILKKFVNNTGHCFCTSNSFYCRVVASNGYIIGAYKID